MNLKSLNNPAQRIATGKTLPVKQLEAIVVYGTPEQRTKVVEKVLPQAAVLSLTNLTHHLVVSIIKNCDNLVRTRMLYELRRKIPDLARSKIGNTVLATILDNCPNTQRKEIAESFTVNVSEDELLDACRNQVAHHSIQKMMEFPASSTVLVAKLAPHLVSLVAHPTGQFVASTIVEHVADGANILTDALFAGGVGDLEALEVILAQVKESPVLCALLKNAITDDEIKEAIIDHVIGAVDELVNLEKKDNEDDDDEEEGPSFGPATDAATKKAEAEPTGRHNFLMAACLEFGSAEQKAALVKALAKHLPQMCATKAQNAVVVELVRRMGAEEHKAVLKALVTDTAAEGKKAATIPIVKVAADIRRTVVLRALIEVRAALPAADIKALVAEAATLAADPVASVVLQRLLEYGDEDVRAALYEATKANVAALALHPIGTYYVQQLLEHTDDDKKRSEMGQTIVKALGDLKEGLGSVTGSRVMQKVVAFVTDKDIKAFVKSLTGFDSDDYVMLTDEEKLAKAEEVKKMNKRERKDNFGAVTGDALVRFALHPHACFVVQALLRETKRRGLEVQRKALMNELKPHVFDLATSPWAGRVVLDTMLTSGSEELKAAIRNVVFLKAENWLTDTSDKSKARGAADPTTRKALRGEHISGSDSRATKKPRTETARPAKAAEAPAAPAKNKKRVFRTLKK